MTQGAPAVGVEAGRHVVERVDDAVNAAPTIKPSTTPPPQKKKNHTLGSAGGRTLCIATRQASPAAKRQPLKPNASAPAVDVEARGHVVERVDDAVDAAPEGVVKHALGLGGHAVLSVLGGARVVQGKWGVM